MEPASENTKGDSFKNIKFGLVGAAVAVLVFVAGLAVGLVAARELPLNGIGSTLFSNNGVSASSVVSPTNSGLNVALMNDVLQRLKSQWYGDMPTGDQLTDGAIRGMVSSLGDPYTAYVEPKYAAILTQDMSSKFEGIGATLKQTTDGAIQIVSTFDDSPARKGGVLAGDVIDAVDGTKVTGLSTTEVAAMVRGTKGTTVTLTLRRAGVAKAFDLALVRAEIDIPLVTSKMLGDGQIGYVGLYDFSAEASAQLNVKVKALLAQNPKPKALILDLRDNPGGYLNQAIDVGSIFLKPGLFVIERDSQGNERRDNTKSGGIATDVPMVVLVNGGSASAAEIVAGALQDYGRAKLFGETTFGKGSVQLPQTLSNGGQLRVTIQHWYTPKNRGIHGVGITPDYVVARTADDVTAGRDPQLDAAVNYLLTGKAPAATPTATVPALVTPTP
jgi:carboxyl-terminal processing protease